MPESESAAPSLAVSSAVAVWPAAITPSQEPFAFLHLK